MPPVLVPLFALVLEASGEVERTWRAVDPLRPRGPGPAGGAGPGATGPPRGPSDGSRPPPTGAKGANPPRGSGSGGKGPPMSGLGCIAAKSGLREGAPAEPGLGEGAPAEPGLRVTGWWTTTAQR